MKYIGFYDSVNSAENRVNSLAAYNKMMYIVRSINKIGLKVKLVSPSWTRSEKGVFSGGIEKVSELFEVLYFPTFGVKSIFLKKIQIIISLSCLFFYLILFAKKNESILVYHSPLLSIPIRFAKRFKRFKLILQVEEIYSSVWKSSAQFKDMELAIIRSADSFICVSEGLRDILSKFNKEIIVVYGDYDMPATPPFQKKGEGGVKLIYAGSIDNVKRGAFNSVEVMNHLPDNYFLNIIGGGESCDVEDLIKKIEILNSSRKQIVCRYLGVFHGIDYSNALYASDIAINPQVNGDYMDTAFPSKIISYLAHGVNVVSTPVASIIKSKVAGSIFFSKDDRPESLASAVMKAAETRSVSSIENIKELNRCFLIDLRAMLSNHSI